MSTDNKKKWKERINYVEDTSTGKIILVGEMVNHRGVLQADDEEDLKKQARSFIETQIEWTKEELQEDEPFECRKLTVEEWDAKDDNIDYWEIERIKRILQRPTVRAIWEKMIGDAIYNGEEEDKAPGDIAEGIMDMLINQDVEQYANR